MVLSLTIKNAVDNIVYYPKTKLDIFPNSESLFHIDETHFKQFLWDH